MAQWSNGYRNSEVFNLHGGEIPLDVFALYVENAFENHTLRIKVPTTPEEIAKYQKVLSDGYRFVGVYGIELELVKELSGTEYSPACIHMWEEYNKYAAKKIEKRKNKQDALDKIHQLTIEIKAIEEEMMLDDRYVLLKSLMTQRKELDKVVSENSK